MGALGNAVHVFVARLPGEILKDRLRREKLRAQTRLVARYELDLVGFLNGCSADELAALAAAAAITGKSAGVLRQQLWAVGAGLERSALGLDPGNQVQPPAVLSKGRLVLGKRRGGSDAGRLPAARAARWPACGEWPRPLPAAREAEPVRGEPDSLDELLRRADGLCGVRLGARGRDKGRHGVAISSLLGIAPSSAATPDWRGEVEVKTLAVVRAQAGWRLKDTPALSMRSVDAAAKLRKVLWIIRVDDAEVPGAPVLSWFYQELDAELLTAFEAARHLRPKGGKGTTAKGWYLGRSFFELCGLMASLNRGA